MAEGEGKISSLLVETRDRASAGQAAPAENIAKRLSASEIVADREGFEPSRRFPAYTRSRRAPSTTRPPVHSESGPYSVRPARGARGSRHD